MLLGMQKVKQLTTKTKVCSQLYTFLHVNMSFEPFQHSKTTCYGP